MADTTKAPTPDAVVLPDVATQPHPVGHVASPADGNGGELQRVLPEVAEAASKVGGYKKLAEIADTLNQMDQ